MHRFLGIALFVLFLLLGNRAAERFARRKLLLEQTATFLFTLKIETAFACRPFPALLRQIALRSNRFSLLCELDRLLQTGTPMPSAWAEAAKKTQGYTAEERAELCAIGNALGTTDRNGQTELLSRAFEWFQSREKTAALQAKQYGVLFRCAGAFAGIAAFIVLF